MKKVILALIFAAFSVTATKSLNALDGEPFPGSFFAPSPVYSIAVSPDGKMVASGYDYGIVRLWDVATGKELRKFQGRQGWVFKVAFSSDGKLLVSGTADKAVTIWDISAGKELRTISDPGMGTQMAVSADGKIVALAGFYAEKTKRIKIWDLSTGTEVQTFGSLTELGAYGQFSELRAIAFSPNGKSLAASCAEGNIDRQVSQFGVHLWEISTGKHLGKINRNFVNGIAFRADGKMLAAASGDTSIYLWDLSVGAEHSPLKGSGTRVWTVAFSPDGNTLASGGGFDTTYNEAILWDVASGLESRRLKSHLKNLTCLAFTPDGKTLLSSSADGTIKIWGMPDGRLLRTLAIDAGLIPQ
ncbi:MAG: WD40 repeat domain-containing protein [Acidobacteriota bacterium]